MLDLTGITEPWRGKDMLMIAAVAKRLQQLTKEPYLKC